MRSLVVLSAVFAVAIAAPSYTSEVLHYQAKALGDHDAITATVFEPVVETHAVYAAPSTVYAAPAAVSHQSRVDVRTSSPTVVAAPAVIAARTVVEPAVVAPVQTVVSAPAAVSHQSRVDVRSSAPIVVAAGPAVIAAKTYGPAQAVIATPTLVNVAPSATVYAGGSAVSHQSRVDVKTSPAVITEQVVEPTYVASPVVEVAPAVVDARSVYVSPVNTLYSAGSAVSHQSRVDVKSSPAVVSEKIVYGPSVYGTTW
ncbi:cuticle protein 38-like [Nymphalis io]|uniref:cuticle protein 38-like n=1 Tax=Inachis io TaxID=171585 RepID=UPI002168732F|nr:cuticle protein 38-like [Nymphalis io]